MGNGVEIVNVVTHWKLVELSSALGENGWLSLARRSQASDLVAGAKRVRSGADGKGRIERMCISVEEILNSKVIKVS